MKNLATKWRDHFFWSKMRNLAGSPFPSLAVDLGSGELPKNDFEMKRVVGIDYMVRDCSNVVKVDLFAGELPFMDNEVGVITAYDFLEHVPRVLYTARGKLRFPLVELMSEVHRVLAPGGVFFSYTPIYPRAEAFGDPTHVNIMSKNTLRTYFAGPAEARRYGFEGTFELVFQGRKGVHQVALLRKAVSEPFTKEAAAAS